MMTGIEILSTTEVMTESTCNWWLAGFIYLGIIILGGIIGFCTNDYLHKSEGIIVGCLIAALMGLFFWAGVCEITSKPVAYETQYKVTIDESVSMVEFIDKYEIIDQEGKIYTVREKE